VENTGFGEITLRFPISMPKHVQEIPCKVPTAQRRYHAMHPTAQKRKVSYRSNVERSIYCFKQLSSKVNRSIMY
jgi:hypothetical protein